MSARKTLLVAAAIGWFVAGLLYRTSPCKGDASLLSPTCLPESLEVAVVFLLLASVPWFTIRAASRQFALVRASAATRRQAFGRYALTALMSVGAVFVAGSAVAVVSQALRLGLFSGEGGLRVVIVALLAGAWALASLVVMALVLGMRKSALECTGTDSRTAR